jgi:hypothetical protein
MPVTSIITVSAHVLAAVFWAGTTFTLARTAGSEAPRLFGPQLGSAAVAIASGGYLWNLTHAGRFEVAEMVLAAGALAAVLALILQAGLGGTALAALRGARISAELAQNRVALSQRAAAGLLTVTVICMVVARYV